MVDNRLLSATVFLGLYAFATGGTITSALAQSGPLGIFLGAAGGSESPPNGLGPEEPPPNPDVIPIVGDSSTPPSEPPIGDPPKEKPEQKVEKAPIVKEQAANPDVVPIVGDSAGPVEDTLPGLKKKTTQGNGAAIGGAGEQTKTIGSKSSDRPKTGGVIAHEPTAPRLPTGLANAKAQAPTTLTTAPKPPTTTFAGPAAAGSVGYRR